MGQLILNISAIIGITLLYFLFYVLFPFWLRGCKLNKGNVLDNLVTSFMVSNFTVISIVYFLVFLKIYNVVTFVISLLLACFAYIYWFRWNTITDAVQRFIQDMVLLSEGKYNGKVMLNNLRNTVHEKIRYLVRKLVTHPVNTLVFLCGFGYAAYFRFYNSATQLHFGTSDLYVHTNWIKYLDNNIVFMNGVYPFGYHHLISAFRKLTGMNLVYLMHHMGGVIGILIVISMYFLCRRIFKSATAANCAFVFYCMCDAIFVAAVNRQTVALPQEYGMMFIYPAGYFLHKYLCKKDIKFAIYFGLAIAMTILSHFYATIVAVMFCGAIAVSHVGYLFQKKTFIRLVAVTLFFVVLAVMPLGIGKLMGIKWEHSLDWATSVLINETIPGEVPIDDLMPSTEGRTLDDIVLNDYIRQITYDQWFFLFILCLGIGGLFALIKIIFKGHREQGTLILGAVIYGIMLVVAMFAPLMGLPSLMILGRATIFYAYISPIILAIPIEILHTIFYRKNYFVRSLYFIMAACIGVSFGYYLLVGNHIMKLGSTLIFQYDGAVATYYRIVNEHPKNNWTIVSPVEETSMVRGDGYHYELRDFMLDMYQVDETTKLYIPTKYVFFFIEKRPLLFNETIEFSEPFKEKKPLITLEDAKVDLYSFGESARTTVLFFYNELQPRRVLEAKAYYWAKEYQKYFPHEMTVYHEDEDIIVYKVTQNMYALNNFAIPYVGNSESVVADE